MMNEPTTTILDLDELQRHITDKYVSVQKHPSADLFIYNYTPRAQYEHVWNDITLQCRGLILDGKGGIVARPFRKFFNLSELTPEQVPNEPFDVFEKMDGSLGIMYWVGDTPAIATRGSFTSPQAMKGTAMLRRKALSGACDLIGSDRATHLFEIIYPENRIVVDYGQREELVHLGTIDNDSGADIEMVDIGFRHTARHDWNGLPEHLAQSDEPNREGFVIRWRSGLRAKVKFAEYLRLHRILTNVSNRVIWEHLRDSLPLDELIDRVPDEFNAWVRRTIHELTTERRHVESRCVIDMENLNALGLATRKEQAEFILKQRHPSILFKMLDGQAYDSIIWKLIEPEYSKPFAENV